MLRDRVSNPGPLTYESGALPIALRGPASWIDFDLTSHKCDNILMNFEFEGLGPRSRSQAIFRKTLLLL